MAEYGLKRRQSSVRKDPPISRDVTGTAYGGRIKNADPTRRYVGVWLKDEASVERYLADGYTYETYREGGPKMAVGATCKPGDQLTYRGNAIMSIDREEYARQQGERQAMLDNERRSRNALRDADGVALRTGGRGIRVEHFEVSLPPPAEPMDGG